MQSNTRQNIFSPVDVVLRRWKIAIATRQKIEKFFKATSTTKLVLVASHTFFVQLLSPFLNKMIAIDQRLC
jgi:hypothetical protein